MALTLLWTSPVARAVRLGDLRVAVAAQLADSESQQSLTRQPKDSPAWAAAARDGDSTCGRLDSEALRLACNCSRVRCSESDSAAGPSPSHAKA